MSVSLPFIPQTGDRLSPEYLHAFVDGAHPYDIGPEAFQESDLRLIQDFGTSPAVTPPTVVRVRDTVFSYLGVASGSLPQTVGAKTYAGAGVDTRLFGWRSHVYGSWGVVQPGLVTAVTLSGTGATEFGYPAGLDRAPATPSGDARLWCFIVDNTNKRLVTRRLPDLVFGEWREATRGGSIDGGRRTLEDPWGVGVHTSFVAVCDRAASAINFYNRVPALNQASLTAFPAIGPAPGTGPEQLLMPHDVALCALQTLNNYNEHHVFVADTENNRISVWYWAPRGTSDIYLSTAKCHLINYGSEGSGQGQFKHPKSVSAPLQNRIFVADTENDRVVRLGWAYPTVGQRMTAASLWWDGSLSIRRPSWVRVAAESPYVIVTSNEDGLVYQVNGWSLSVTRVFGAPGTGATQFSDLQCATVFANYQGVAFDDGLRYNRMEGSLPVIVAEGRPRVAVWSEILKPWARGSIVRFEPWVDLRTTNWTLGGRAASLRMVHYDGFPHFAVAVLDETAATAGRYYPVTMFGLTWVMADQGPFHSGLSIEPGQFLYWRGRERWLYTWDGSDSFSAFSQPAGLFAGYALSNCPFEGEPEHRASLCLAWFWPYCELRVPSSGWANYSY